MQILDEEINIIKINFYPPSLKSNRGYCNLAKSFCVSMCMYSVQLHRMFQLDLVFIIRVSFEKLKSNYKQTWVKDAIGVPSYVVDEVKGHIPRSRVIWGHVRWKILVFVTWVSVEKLRSLIGTKLGSKMQWGFLCILMRSKVIHSQGSSEVKSSGKCKFAFF